MATENKALIYASVPSGWPIAGQDLLIKARPFEPSTAPPVGGITTENFYFSFDPYQRGRMRSPEKASYNQPYTLNEPIANSGIARVLQSSSERYTSGDIIFGMLPIEEYSHVTAEALASTRKIENPYNLDLKLFLGVLGMPGLTAFSSFYDIGKPVKGETIFISAASGAVGQIVGQLAKHEGLHVIGSVGDDRKLDYITRELGFDGGFNYKTEKVAEALTRLAPGGIDIYYDNVGGEQLDVALGVMRDFGRIVNCGMISQYNLKPDEVWSIKNIMNLVSKRLTMRGFIVMDANMGPKYAKEHQEKMQKWIHEGTFKSKQSLTLGMDNAVEGFLGMLRGDNFGKAVLVVKELKV